MLLPAEILIDKGEKFILNLSQVPITVGRLREAFAHMMERFEEHFFVRLNSLKGMIMIFSHSVRSNCFATPWITAYWAPFKFLTPRQEPVVVIFSGGSYSLRD